MSLSNTACKIFYTVCAARYLSYMYYYNYGSKITQIIEHINLNFIQKTQHTKTNKTTDLNHGVGSGAGAIVESNAEWCSR